LSEAGWYKDPTGQHELRWFDGSTWTSHVHTFETSAPEPSVATVSATSSASPTSAPSPTPTAAAAGSPTVTAAAPSTTELAALRAEGAKELVAGLAVIAGGVAVALAIGAATSAASEAAGGGGGGVRVWSVPVFALGLIKVVTGVGKLSRGSSGHQALPPQQPVAVAATPEQAAARAVALLTSNGAVVSHQSADGVTGHVPDGAIPGPFALSFTPCGEGCAANGSGTGRGDKAVRWVLAQLAQAQ
jgi:hypothetical protein